MKTITIILFFLSSFSVLAQGDYVPKLYNKKAVWGCQANYFNNFDLNFKAGIGFSTSVLLKKQNHTFAIGPMWWIDKNYEVNTFRGGIFSYQYFPNKHNKRIHFYFIYDLAYTFEKSGWDRNMRYGPNTYYNVSYKTSWHSLKNQLGYGFNVNIYKGLYLTQGMSIGVEYYNTNSETKVKENPSLSSTYSSGNIFSGSGTSSFLKLGIGYNYEK